MTFPACKPHSVTLQSVLLPLILVLATSHSASATDSALEAFTGPARALQQSASSRRPPPRPSPKPSPAHRPPPRRRSPPPKPARSPKPPSRRRPAPTRSPPGRPPPPRSSPSPKPCKTLYDVVAGIPEASAFMRLAHKAPEVLDVLKDRSANLTLLVPRNKADGVNSFSDFNSLTRSALTVALKSQFLLGNRVVDDHWTSSKFTDRYDRLAGGPVGFAVFVGGASSGPGGQSSYLAFTVGGVYTFVSLEMDPPPKRYQACRSTVFLVDGIFGVSRRPPMAPASSLPIVPARPPRSPPTPPASTRRSALADTSRCTRATKPDCTTMYQVLAQARHATAFLRLVNKVPEVKRLLMSTTANYTLLVPRNQALGGRSFADLDLWPRSRLSTLLKWHIILGNNAIDGMAAYGYGHLYSRLAGKPVRLVQFTADDFDTNQSYSYVSFRIGDTLTPVSRDLDGRQGVEACQSTVEFVDGIFRQS